MTYPHGPTPWPPRSERPDPPPSPPHPSMSDGHVHHGNLFLMVGELMGGMRWLIWDANRKTTQIEDLQEGQQNIQQQLRDGSHQFKDHDARLTNQDARLRCIEEEHVSRLERLSKRWAAFLLPPATAVVTYYLTGNLEAAMKLAAQLPK